MSVSVSWSTCRQLTFRYEQSCVEEVRESVAVVAFSFSFLVALLTDDESREGPIHRVIGHLAWREDRCRSRELLVTVFLSACVSVCLSVSALRKTGDLSSMSVTFCPLHAGITTVMCCIVLYG